MPTVETRGRPLVVERRSFYRLVRREEPTTSDFESNAARGIPLRDPAYLDEHQGVSAWGTIAQAKKRSMARPGQRYFVAELDLPNDGSIRFARTFPTQGGHHTIWASPGILLGLVVRVHVFRKALRG